MTTVSTLPEKVSGMSMRDYLSRPELSRSFISSCMDGGGEAQKYQDEGFSLFSGNSATTLGSQFDALVMGVIAGKGLGEQVAIPPAEVLGKNGARSTKDYKEWLAKQTDKIPCSEEEYWKFQRMLAALQSHAYGWSVIEDTVATQNSYFATVFGHAVKVRPDGETESLWWDLKTTSAPKSQLARSVKQFHYGEQQWLYCAVAEEFGMPPFRMPFIFVSTVPPFWCEVFLLPQDYVAECGERMKNAMDLIRLRRETGEYLPLDHGTVKELEIPEWVRKTTEVF